MSSCYLRLLPSSVVLSLIMSFAQHVFVHVSMLVCMRICVCLSVYVLVYMCSFMSACMGMIIVAGFFCPIEMFVSLSYWEIWEHTPVKRLRRTSQLLIYGVGRVAWEPGILWKWGNLNKPCRLRRYKLMQFTQKTWLKSSYWEARVSRSSF